MACDPLTAAAAKRDERFFLSSSPLCVCLVGRRLKLVSFVLSRVVVYLSVCVCVWEAKMKSPRVNVSSRVNVSRVTLIQKCLDGTLTRCATTWMSSTCLSKSFSLIRFSVFLFGWTTCFIFTPRYRDHVDSRTFTFTFYFPFSFLFSFIFTASFILFCAKAILNVSSQVDSDTTTTTTMS